MATTTTEPRRFKVGDRVGANTNRGWAAGTVVMLDYREDDWPDGRTVPYQIELDDGALIFAPVDSPDILLPESNVPWHKLQGGALARADIGSVYPKQARHPEIFDPAQVDGWFVPALRAALARWQESGDPKDIDIAAVPGLRLEAPGVVSFDCFEPAFCDKLLAEAKNYSSSEMPQRPPNSMNNCEFKPIIASTKIVTLTNLK